MRKKIHICDIDECFIDKITPSVDWSPGLIFFSGTWALFAPFSPWLNFVSFIAFGIPTYDGLIDFTGRALFFIYSVRHFVLVFGVRWGGSSIDKRFCPIGWVTLTISHLCFLAVRISHSIGTYPLFYESRKLYCACPKGLWMRKTRPEKNWLNMVLAVQQDSNKVNHWIF